jgi:transposase InsO family protein
MYIWVGCRHYFLLSFVDAYSRYVVHHRLLLELTGRAVAIELEAALSKCKGVRPRIVHDGDNYLSAERIVARLIDEYHNVRLHAALGYFAPREVHFGNIAQRREVRRQKLETDREQRRTQNRSLMAA